MNFVLILVLFIIFFYYLIKKKYEYFSDEFFDRMCLDDFYVCKNYKKCCDKDNYYKLGHAKHCNNVIHNTNCNSYRKQTINPKTYNSYNEYSPGFSYIPFYNWNNKKKSLCYIKKSQENTPQGIFLSKLAYISKKVGITKTKETETDIFNDITKNKLLSYKKFVKL